MTTIRAVVFISVEDNDLSLISGVHARLQRGGLCVAHLTHNGISTAADEAVCDHGIPRVVHDRDMPHILAAWATERQLSPSELLLCLLGHDQQTLPESAGESPLEMSSDSESFSVLDAASMQAQCMHVSPEVWQTSLPGVELVCLLTEKLSAHKTNPPGNTMTAWMNIPALLSEAMLFQHITNINLSRKPELLVVGYAMKASRELDLAKSGLLNLVPQDGVVCMPLDFTRPLSSQLPVHLLLHKASDELVQSAAGQPFQFSANIAAMQAFSLEHPNVCVVDSFSSMENVIDRVRLSQLTTGLDNLRVGDPSSQQIRSPCFATCSSATEAYQTANSAGLKPPLIVKSSVACGLAGAHAMVLVLSLEGLRKLEMEGGLVIQEFVNHGGVVHKVYVAGSKVFCTTRPSIPDIAEGFTTSSKLVYFDSLKNLPVDDASLVVAGHTPGGTAVPSSSAAAIVSSLEAPSKAVLDMDALECIADYLRSHFHLTLFGFDVILGAVDQVLYVIDVNYFPHFKGISSAAGHVRSALKMAHTAHLTAQAATVLS